MKKTAILIILGLLIIFLIGCESMFTSEVQTGTKTVCSKCGKVIRDDSRTIKIAKSEAKNYSVTTLYNVCDECIRAEKEAERKRELIKFKNPNKVANGFFQALKNRNINEAIKYCDVSIKDEVGFKFAWMSFSPQEICPVLAREINGQHWKLSKVFRRKNEKGLEEGLYFNIVNTKTIRKYNDRVMKFEGMGLGMHQIGEKWLIFKIYTDYRGSFYFLEEKLINR